MQKRIWFYVVFTLVLLLVLVLVGYLYPWTGFGEHYTSAGELIPAKKLWDWLDLLVVPAVLALGAYLLEGSRKRSERRVETDRQRQNVLQEYFDYISELILEGHLSANETASVARELARTRTLAALRLLDGKRKAQLLQFLYEAGLIRKDPIVQLNGADLSKSILDEASLPDAEIRGAYFAGASIRCAQLIRADLRGSDFSGADFSYSDMSDARLNQATVDAAVFKSAVMNGTNLSDVEESKLDLSEEQRQQVII